MPQRFLSRQDSGGVESVLERFLEFEHRVVVGNGDLYGEAGLGAIVTVRAGFFEQLPVKVASIDVVISNGVVNLAPDKSQVFAEIYRVLRPGGRLYLADVVVQRELKYEVRNSPDLWTACIAGALPEGELTELAIASRFHEPRIMERFDCFGDTTAEAKVARDLHMQAVNFFARK